MNLRPYLVVFRSSVLIALRERTGMGFRVLFFTIILVINSALWYAATHEGTRLIHEYSHADLLWYILVTEVAIFAAPSVRIEQIGNEIADRSIEVEMLRPTSVIGVRLASEFGLSIGRSLVLLISGSLVVTLLAGEPDHVVGVLFALPLLALALACLILGIHAFASISFWIRDAKSMWFLFQKSVFFIGGMLFPLSFLPGWLESVAWFFPFWTMAYAPASFVSGDHNWMLLLGQVIWLGVLAGVTLRMFAAGEKRTQAGAN